jgi:hypothetical protein
MTHVFTQYNHAAQQHATGPQASLTSSAPACALAAASSLRCGMSVYAVSTRCLPPPPPAAAPAAAAAVVAACAGASSRMACAQRHREACGVCQGPGVRVRRATFGRQSCHRRARASQDGRHLWLAAVQISRGVHGRVASSQTPCDSQHGNCLTAQLRSVASAQPLCCRTQAAHAHTCNAASQVVGARAASPPAAAAPEHAAPPRAHSRRTHTSAR